LKINFIIPFIGKTGGIAVILQHARGLRALGHDVAVYYPLLPYRQFLYEEKSAVRKYLFGQAKPLLGNLARYRRRVTWSEDAPVRPVPWIAAAFLRDADIVVASAWPTAYGVAKLPPGKGRKFYFIQHYEVWSSDPALVDASYLLPLSLLTIAPWLTSLLKEKFGREVAAEIHNGIDIDFFTPPTSRTGLPCSILMMYHELEWKGCRFGLAALEAIHARHPNIPIRLFGIAARPGVPDYFEYHRDPSPERLRSLYRAAHIFISPSLKEGWHLPPMEAMACGCALVATKVGCIPVLDDGMNMLAAEPGSAEALEKAMESLIRDPFLLRAMADRGLGTISRFTWPRATRTLERNLLDTVSGGKED